MHQKRHSGFGRFPVGSACQRSRASGWRRCVGHWTVGTGVRFHEVWINHPEFDLPRLKGALQVKEASPLFDFRKVRDIATIRKSGISLPKIENSNRERHDAVLDATWNLQVALAWHHRVHQINHLESTLSAAAIPVKSDGSFVTPLPTFVARSLEHV